MGYETIAGAVPNLSSAMLLAVSMVTVFGCIKIENKRQKRAEEKMMEELEKIEIY